MKALVNFGLGAAIFSLIASGVYFGILNGVFKIQEIELQAGQGEILADEVRAEWAARIKSLEGHYIWEKSIREISSKISKDPRVAEVQVKRRLPNRLKISLVTHQPFLMLMGKTGLPSFVSNLGTIIPKKAGQKIPDVPVLRGMIFHKDEGKRRLAVKMMMDLGRYSSNFAQKISEIHFSDREGFWMNIAPAGVMVKLGEGQWVERSHLVERVLNYLDKHQLQARVIDARFDKKVVVRLHNAP